jgi:hypothetical protein
MRVEYWNEEAGYQDFSNVSKERVLQAANVIKGAVKRHLKRQIGTGETTGISRPVYKTGKYAGQPWTSRNFGELVKSVRVTQKKESNTGILSKKNVRVYAGNYMAYYASIFEHDRPFMRPAVEETLSEVKQIMGVK